MVILAHADAANLDFVADESVQLTVTSPPYDNLRTYNGYNFDFEAVANELFRVTSSGGVVVWVVGDATIKGSETGASFRQALYFKEIGFNLHDTMIWNKGGFSAVGALVSRYAPVFEYMLIFTKGKLLTFNPLKDRKNKYAGDKMHGTITQADGTTRPKSNQGKVSPEYGQRFNIWDIPAQRQRGYNRHPAPFPEQLAADHITTWSNPGDLILDPFSGSGTTAKMAHLLGREFIGCDISMDYLELAKERVEKAGAEVELLDLVSV